jgi:hypothetical protein
MIFLLSRISAGFLSSIFLDFLYDARNYNKMIAYLFLFLGHHGEYSCVFSTPQN